MASSIHCTTSIIDDYYSLQKLIVGTNYGFIRGQRLATLSELNGKANSSHNHAASNITSGTLPVARGGTGITSNPSMLVNLGSTSAASTFAASPRPGVTGTLPVARGGTGVTSLDALKTALGISSSGSGPFSSEITWTSTSDTIPVTLDTLGSIANNASGGTVRLTGIICNSGFHIAFGYIRVTGTIQGAAVSQLAYYQISTSNGSDSLTWCRSGRGSVNTFGRDCVYTMGTSSSYIYLSSPDSGDYQNSLGNLYVTIRTNGQITSCNLTITYRVYRGVWKS